VSTTEDRSVADLEGEALSRVTAARSVADLDAVRQEFLGKRSPFAGLHRGLGSLPPEDRKEAGRTIREAQARLAEALDRRRDALGSSERATRLEAERLDLTEVVGQPSRGHLHLVTQARDQLEDVFVSMGYSVAEGPEAETDWYNFEALNMPPDHPDGRRLRLHHPDLHR